jgi:hypothetical protein
MRKLTELQIEELQSFGYMVRNNDDIKNMEKKMQENAKENKPLSVKLPSKDLTDDKKSIDEEDFSYLDELET